MIKIETADCTEFLDRLLSDVLPPVLVFCDPPFNIDYSYDQYQDDKEAAEYLAWSEKWIQKCFNILDPHRGSFWLHIGDKYAAELNVLCKKIGFIQRSWVIWYFTFGVNCTAKFTPSHTHLFHFIKDPKGFIHNDQAVKVPSARQLVYNDKRAKSGGRLPDDTWILRPQDVEQLGGICDDHSLWYVSRVAGTFKERAGFHGCQMPERVLERIIKYSSNEGDVVVDPMLGSGTTAVVAKKLGRSFMGCDISDNYVAQAIKRIDDCKVGDPISGAEYYSSQDRRRL